MLRSVVGLCGLAAVLFLTVLPTELDAAANDRALPVATQDKRIALVIGVGNYKSAPPLANPVNDARRISEAFRRLNFEVEEKLDPDFASMNRSLREFGMRAQNADAAIVFYAGHGVQVDHENYLIPADAKLERERDLLYEAMPLDLFLGEVSQARKVGIVMLDACRNNPFSDRMSRSLTIAGRGPSSGKGLARVDKVPRNTVVAMATKADEIAEDGSGDDSPFTQALLAHLQVPGVELSLFFRSVRDSVLKATNYRQEPYVFSSLGAEPFYFYPVPPNRPPEIGQIKPLEIGDRAEATPLGIPQPTDPDGDPLSVKITALPKSGEVRSGDRVIGRNEVLALAEFMASTYKPDGKTLGGVGNLEFAVQDGRGGNVTGSLPITVVSTNRPPIVEAQHQAKIYPGALGITPPTDPDGDPMTVTISGLPSRGVTRIGTTVVKNGDRVRPQDLPMLTFTPEFGTTGDVGSLRYMVDDGRGGKAEGRVDVSVARVNESGDMVSAKLLWEGMRDSGSGDDLDAFLRLFPNSRYADEARERRQALGPGDSAPPPAAMPVAQAAPPAANPPASRVGPAPQPAPQAQAPPPQAPPPRRNADDRVASLAPQSAAQTPQQPAPQQPAEAAPAPTPPIAMAVPPPTRGGSDARSFQDCPTCPVMVKVPGGSFVMGRSSGDPTATPAHNVTLRPFAMGQFSVTVAEWKACVADRGCNGVPRMSNPADRTPVHNVSWDDAQQFVTWLARKTGRPYRLPTEAEWEYAARARAETRYWWGDDLGVGRANCSDCGGKQDHLTPMPVGSFPPNPFGLYDVHGGVAEWVADCWYPNYQGAPTDGAARMQKGCETHVLRGGSYRSDRNKITAASRNFYDASVRYLDHGFRVALGVE
jgi:formylglycine-generating enzyme required for sulfatase activity